MDYQVSARKYRPLTFADVIGQPHVVQTLINSINSKRIAHAYLFSGTRGVGKTTVARILAKALNCEQGPTGTPCGSCTNCQEIALGTSVDVIEIDGASNTSVDDVREIRENVKFTPFRGTYRVYIIDEVHMLSNSAFNALLKTLEEPPSHVVFIFATTEIHKIPATILSRCQHYNFRRIPRAEIVDRLRHVATQDMISLEERSLTALARSSGGSLRDALSLLDQAVAFGGRTIVHEDLEALLGTVPQDFLLEMIHAITAQDSAAALRVLARLLDQGYDLRAYCADIVEYLRNLLVISVTSPSEWPKLIDSSADDLAQLASDKGSLTPEQLERIFTLFTQAEDTLRFSAHPRFVLETAAVKATRLLITDPGSTGQPVRVTSAERTAQSQPLRRDTPVPQDRPKASVADSATLRASIPASTPSPASPLSSKAANDSAKSEITTTQAIATTSIRTSAGPSDSLPVALNWERIQDEMGQVFPNIAPFLEMGRLVTIEGNLVTIGFAKQASVARSILEKKDNIQALGSLCERLSGKPVRLRVVELTEADPPGPTMAQTKAAKIEEHKLVLFEQAKAHPVVKQALEFFGAELADVRALTDQQEVQE